MAQEDKETAVLEIKTTIKALKRCNSISIRQLTKIEVTHRHQLSLIENTI